MRWLVQSWVIIFNLLLPGALLFWLFKTTAASRIYLFSIVLLIAVFLAVMKWSIFGFWYVVGIFWPAVFVVAFLAILFHRLRRGLPASWLPRRWGTEFFLTGVNVLHTAAWALTIPFLLDARTYTEEPLKLLSPLGSGTYLVMTGVANFSVNQHVAEPSSKYAMDITRLNAFGLRAAGMFPDELSKYAVFGTEIIAPCAGEVISAEASLPNRMPLDPDGSDRTGGNHVVLYCHGHSVHLAHVDTGTVAVAVGDRVLVGQLLGRVGNSGNSMEPHLHVSAVQGRHTHFRDAARSPNGVKSIPLLIDGRFLIKGDSFTH